MNQPRFEQVYAAVSPEGVSLALADEPGAVTHAYPNCEVIDFDQLALWSEQASVYAPMSLGEGATFVFLGVRHGHEEGLFTIRANSPNQATQGAAVAFPALSMKLLGSKQTLDSACAMACQLVERSHTHLACRDLRKGVGSA